MNGQSIPPAGYALRARPHAFLPPGTLAGFMIAIATVLIITALSWYSLETRSVTAARIAHSVEIVNHLQVLLSTMKDAETGQRGFLLTGTEQYLDPYTAARAAIPSEISSLRGLTQGDASRVQQVDVLERLTSEKMEELAQTIALQRSGDAAGALAAVRTDRGKAAMEAIRESVAGMMNAEQRVLADNQAEWQDAVRTSSLITLTGAGLLLSLILAGMGLSSREYRARETETWIRAGHAELSSQIQGEQRLEVLGARVLEFLAGFLDAQVGAVHIVEMDDTLRRFAGYALAPDADGAVVRPGEGLLGQAAKENRPLHVTAVPAGYLTVNSSTGRHAPAHLLIVPAAADGIVYAVVELGFLHDVQSPDQELLARVSHLLAVAVRSARDRSRLEELLMETQRQAEELQSQQEELRVSNEELEEQGRVLKLSQAQLESQQEELEQANTQLEEHAQVLDRQKEELAAAHGTLLERAALLERATRYKSEFLANMSHELRTPLNSSLILSKLLAENKEGNLTDEQVEFARTISSSGIDLLNLINDILDLSKIEAGKIDLQPEEVAIGRVVDEVVKPLLPAAQQKGLELTSTIAPGVAPTLQTDPQRLAQILKNFLSNALKFTAKGEVSLRVSTAANGDILFAVHDTGIGIEQDEQSNIFEAFRQADGSTQRKYGGTGLGLSISQDLARLLGGSISVQSAPGKGSIFTLAMPPVYSGSGNVTTGDAAGPDAAPAAVAVTAEVPRRNKVASRPPAAAPLALADDRDQLAPEVPLILVVEDDISFAAILRNLAHEMRFQCVVTHTAADGMAAAKSYRPSAVVLDINLPDHSGLAVLSSLKRNPDTRHIPVHIVSVSEHMQQALELGAVGYALKPVKREELIEAFEKLKAKFSQGTRRVLVVEDDVRQRESIRALLENDDVEITGAESARRALELLQSTTFDCVVMDLNLPDISGYELLQKMSERDDVSFPPVIVYTGRSLTADEEQALRRFSRSIILKDARSPERLLDEVTLFLHQVEARLPPERQKMLQAVRNRDEALDGRRILVVEDDVRNIFALSKVLEPNGVILEIARNGKEALEALDRASASGRAPIDMVLMDIMMPEMDGFTATREIRKRPEWKTLPIIALTAKAMKDDREKCLDAGANDYIAKPLDVEKLLSLVRVWMPK